MHLIKLTSSAIFAAGYDSLTRDLEVIFRDKKSGKEGGHYCYQQVPQAVALRLITAEANDLSAGQIHSREIKGCYPFTQIG